MQGTQLNPEVRGFNRLQLRIQNHVCALSLSQGDEEALTLHGPSNLLARINPSIREDTLKIELGGSLSDRIGDAFTTSLSREKIGIDLVVCELQELDLGGFVEGIIFGLDVSDLSLNFTGLGKLKVARICGNYLTATLQGSPSIQVSGEVEEQHVTVKGMGQYRAGNLKTQKTAIHLSGSTFATIWAEQDLKVDMQGMGSIEYYGRPSVSRRTIGMNKLKPLGVR